MARPSNILHGPLILQFMDSYKKLESVKVTQSNNMTTLTKDNLKNICGIHTIKTAHESNLIICERKFSPHCSTGSLLIPVYLIMS